MSLACLYGHNDKLFLRNGRPGKGAKPYFQVGTFVKGSHHRKHYEQDLNLSSEAANRGVL